MPRSTATASDFNDIMQAGTYWINPNLVTSNHPMPGYYGVLEVLATGIGVIQQNFYMYDNIGVSPVTRQYTNDAWTPWQNKVRLWTDSEGGNISIYGPNNNEWQIDSYDSSQLRIYTWKNGEYRGVSINNDGQFVGNLIGTASMANSAMNANSAINAQSAGTATGANRLNLATSNPTYSTPADWGSANGSGVKLYWFDTTGKIANQPAQYGFLLHLGLSYGEGHQIWTTQSNGDLYHRGFNASSNLSNVGFKKILDTSNGIASLSGSGIYAGRSLGVYASSETMIAGTDKGNRIWSCSTGSDKRLKENIKDSEVKGLDLINAIHLVEFDFKEKKFGTHEEIGYIAQELIEVIPEAVVELPTEDEDKKYGDSLFYVEDKPLIKYLVKAVQELTDIVNKQQIQIEELQEDR